MKKAYQLSSLGVPLKHFGAREFTEFEWDRLMAWYKSRGVKPRWGLVKEEVKKPIRRKAKEKIDLEIIPKSVEVEIKPENVKVEIDVKPNNDE